MKRVLFVGLVLFPLFCIGQTILDTTKIWSIYNEPCAQNLAHTYYLKVGGDTVIHGSNYKKILKSYKEDQSEWIYDCALGEHEGRYSVWNGTKKYVLYDFNLEIGDTTWSDIFIVADIDSVFFANQNRKRIRFRRIDEPFYPDFCETWYSGIGSLSGLLSPYTFVLVGDWHYLICYWENDSLVYHTDMENTCFTGELQVPKQQISGGINLYPNPVKRCLNLRTFQINNPAIEYELWNVQSTLIRTEEIRSEEIDVTFLPEGVYILKIRLFDGNVVTKRFVKL